MFLLCSTLVHNHINNESSDYCSHVYELSFRSWCFLYSKGIETAFSEQCFIQMSLLSSICKNGFTAQKTSTHFSVPKLRFQLMSARASAASERGCHQSCSQHTPSALHFWWQTTHPTLFLKIPFSLKLKLGNNTIPDLRSKRLFSHGEPSCLSRFVPVPHLFGLSFNSLLWCNSLKSERIV